MFAVKMFATTKFMRFCVKQICLPRVTFLASVRSFTKASQRQNNIPTFGPPTLGLTLLTLLGLEKETTPEDELIESIKYSILFIQKSEFDRAERLLHVALRQAQQMHHENAITYIYDVMANLALQRKQLEKAKKLFVSVTQRLMQGGVTEDDLKVIHISVKLARISHLQKEFETARTGFEWCLEKLTREFRKNPSDTLIKLLAMAEDWYGKLHLECNNPERALELLLSSQERTSSLEEFEDEHSVIQFNDIAIACEELDRFEESENYLKEAIRRGKDLAKMEDLGVLYVNLGRLYLRRGLIEEARKSCGYGWRLGHDRGNEMVKNEAQECVDEIKNAQK